MRETIFKWSLIILGIDAFGFVGISYLAKYPGVTITNFAALIAIVCIALAFFSRPKK